eukprot:CAMPEP_0197449420 /NCGR_PEP_ID=MMETSP1175-20131217/21424_1 /TAXON_ID=1003142 /ORGANISM="Triceratium dubium, Strain CCMP147" /LENGTH=73 /DNA_ID=CAMNT_0042981549 /DNA_START=182 /DNA_END=403 /DNA_ORIENTATION=+
MGNCLKSNQHSHLETVDDSVHVMISHDKKKQRQEGKPVSGYVPRAEHPSLAKAKKAEEDKPNGGSTGGTESSS